MSCARSSLGRGRERSELNIEITFLGATGTVTGCKYLVNTGGKKILVDCGLFQGYKQLRLCNRAPLPVNLWEIDAVILNYAHIDHSGYLPLLIKKRFRRQGTAARPRAICAPFCCRTVGAFRRKRQSTSAVTSFPSTRRRGTFAGEFRAGRFRVGRRSRLACAGAGLS